MASPIRPYVEVNPRKSIVIMLAMLLGTQAQAHNKTVHHDVVDVAYEIMLLVERRVAQGEGNELPQPEGATTEAWTDFLNRIAATPGTVRT
jgi:hypothetical protein